MRLRRSTENGTGSGSGPGGNGCGLRATGPIGSGSGIGVGSRSMSMRSPIVAGRAAPAARSRRGCRPGRTGGGGGSGCDPPGPRPNGDIAGISGGRLVLPRQDGADAGQHRRRTELAQRREHDPDDVDVGMVEVTGAVASSWRRRTPAWPRRPRRPNRIRSRRRSGHARPNRWCTAPAVAERLLDDDRRLQPVELGAVQDAADLLVPDVGLLSSTALKSSPSWLSFSVPK